MADKTIKIRQAKPQDLDQVLRLSAELFQDNDPQELAGSYQKSLINPQEAFFLVQEGPEAIGFAHMSIRHDYVEGALEDQACAYLEAIYIQEDWRLQGLGRRLVQVCRQWARDQGCRQLASDTPLDNQSSLDFHLKLGFSEAGRLVHFIEILEEA
ncbi:MAG: GNAT family N-acetyltransferase [Clostridiaceae bacterium]|jgi:aminoglycoside 6'-N-acetyltransferase I|nr:GNAT family N-acetyltransferase [Clostridiaceae bacterium]